MVKKAGRVLITYELLEAALQLDKKHKITRTHDCSLFESNESLWIRITGPDMPVVSEGSEIPVVDLPVQQSEPEEQYLTYTVNNIMTNEETDKFLSDLVKQINNISDDDLICRV